MFFDIDVERVDSNIYANGYFMVFIFRSLITILYNCNILNNHEESILIEFGRGNKILKNNFIGNYIHAYFMDIYLSAGLFFNHWNGNHWDNWSIVYQILYIVSSTLFSHCHG